MVSQVLCQQCRQAPRGKRGEETTKRRSLMRSQEKGPLGWGKGRRSWELNGTRFEGEEMSKLRGRHMGMTTPPPHHFPPNPRIGLAQADSFLALPHQWSLPWSPRDAPIWERNMSRDRRRVFSAMLGLRNFFWPVIYLAAE